MVPLFATVVPSVVAPSVAMAPPSVLPELKSRVELFVNSEFTICSGEYRLYTAPPYQELLPENRLETMVSELPVQTPMAPPPRPAVLFLNVHPMASTLLRQFPSTAP